MWGTPFIRGNTENVFGMLQYYKNVKCSDNTQMLEKIISHLNIEKSHIKAGDAKKRKS